MIPLAVWGMVLALIVTIGSVVASKSDSAQTTFVDARQLRAVIQHEAVSPGQPPCNTVPCPNSVPQGHGKAAPQGHGNALRAEVRHSWDGTPYQILHEHRRGGASNTTDNASTANISGSASTALAGTTANTKGSAFHALVGATADEKTGGPWNATKNHTTNVSQINGYEQREWGELDELDNMKTTPPPTTPQPTYWTEGPRR